MAKKIRLDFTKVEERSGWNTRLIADGLHEMEIVSVQETEASDGTDMLVYALRPTAAKYKTRLFPFYCKLQQNQYWKLRDLFIAAGVEVPKKVVTLDPGKVVGKKIAAEVEEETGQYAGRSQVQATYPLDILDEDGGDSEPDDDEEYDEEEVDEDEVDDEAEGGDEDELREELEALTLPQLRKRAKDNGIDHAGVKKADLLEMIIEEELGEVDDDEDEDLDDEDLDDEELEEDEFEDEDEEEEEEEPEPAPRRRAAAPAKKAPAKAAPAPTRRTVKRR